VPPSEFGEVGPANPELVQIVVVEPAQLGNGGPVADLPACPQSELAEEALVTVIRRCAGTSVSRRFSMGMILSGTPSRP